MSNTTERKSDFWRIYFFFLILPGMLGFLWSGFPRAYEVIDLIVYSFATLGLYLYIWNKTLFTKSFWKVHFFLQIAWAIFYGYLIPVPEMVFGTFGMSQAVYSSINLIGYIPLYLALYLYAFGKKSLWPKS